MSGYLRMSSLVAASAVFASAIAIPAPAMASEGDLRTSLFGAYEFSGNTGNLGDPDGFGSAIVNLVSTSQLCYAIIVQGIDTPTLAHIHEGAPGVSGPPVVTLNPPKKGTAGTAAGCVKIPRNLLLDIGRFPAKYYINVHTVNFPSGALRGQLQ